MNPVRGLLVLLCAVSLCAAEPAPTDAPPQAATEAPSLGPTGAPALLATDSLHAASTDTAQSVPLDVPPLLSTETTHPAATDTVRPAAADAAPAVLSPAAARPPQASTATWHLASFRRPQVALSLPLLEPLERLLRQGEFILADVEGQVGHGRGKEYLYQVARPAVNGSAVDASTGPATRDAAVLATAGGYLLLPEDPGAAERLTAAARDPLSYRDGRVPKLAARRAQLTATPMLDGSVIYSLKFLEGRGAESSGWQNVMVRIYRLRKGFQDVEAVFLYTALGGEGRIAWLMEDYHRRFGDSLLVLSRGELFSYGPGASSGAAAGLQAEGLGVDAAALGSGELARLRDLLSYRATRGDGGVAFLSANLVFSSDTKRSLLPASRLWSVGGRTAAVFGLTDPEWARYIQPELASQLSLTDPIAAAAAVVPALRRQADIVVALSNLPASDNALLRRRVRGIDLIVGDSFPFETETGLPTITVSDPERGPSDEALLVTADGTAIVSHLEVMQVSAPDGRTSLSVKQEHVFLDESVPEAPGHAALQPENYGVSSDTRPAVIPSARRLYAGTPASAGTVRLRQRDFWTLAASVALGAIGAEAAFVPVFGIYDDQCLGDYREDTVRQWFQLDDELRVFELSGSDLQALLGEVRRQERGGDVPKGGLSLAAAGFGEGDTLHGTEIQSGAVYRVAATDRLLARAGQFPAFGRAERVQGAGPLREVVAAGLRRAADSGLSVEEYRKLLKGRTLSDDAFWVVNFRDISIKATNTKVVSDPAFDNVSNARIRGFDEQLIGGVTKVDVERTRGKFRWTNMLELEYSRSRLSPPGQAPILNTPMNRSSLLSLGTLKVGDFPWHWMARSFGPSFGAQYEGDIERLPGLRRKHVFSLYPGVELFNGSWIQSLGVAANLRRDFTPLSPLNAYGVRVRTVASHSVGANVLQAECLANWFIRTRRDTTQDLRLEVNAITKLQIPIYKRLTLIPFLDFYYFILKVRPVSGYSAIMGMSLGFTRLWKPQFESF